ncbi:hypothetical protein N7507_009705 [Penicillium longicatenatum]|nr:hypothetical protein N7507_009705 [Penicillium longicatenatum]
MDGLVSETASCQCCWDSSFLSEFIEWCPNNDLSAIDIDLMVETFQIGYNESASDECSILSEPSQCVSSFTLDTGASTWYNPGQLPSGFPGTAPLSDTTDAGSITSAPDPYTFSIFPSYVTVITPAPFNEKNVEATSSETVVGTAATATGESTSLPSTSKGAARNLVSPMSTDVGTWGLLLYIIACTLFGAALIA